MFVEPFCALLDRLERAQPSSRLLVAWAACALPRAALAAIVGLDEDYGYFIHGRTNSAWYPLYEWLAASLWSLTGGSVRLYFAAHLAIHSLLGPIVYGLTRKLGLGARAAWLAVIGVAFMPYYVSLSARQPQVGITIVMVAALLLVYAGWTGGRRSRGAGILFAAMCGLTIAIRPNALSVIAVLYLLALAGTGDRPQDVRRGRLVSVLTSGGVFAAILLALAAINLQREGRFSPFTGNVGFNLYVGNNPHVGEYALRYDITSLQDSLDESLPPDYATTPNEERDDLLRRAALDYMSAHPGQSIWNAVLKTWRYWDPRLEDARLTPLHWNLAYTLPYVVYGLLALGGAWILWKRGSRSALLVIVATLLAYWLPHAVFFGSVRMRMTTEFLLIVLAACAVAAWIDDRRPAG
jgi:4-amino-4-deoxy-L-arabinose transferase-like glycosyltransferase